MSPGVWKALGLKKKLGYKIYFWSESHLKEDRNYGKIKVKIRNLYGSLFIKNLMAFGMQVECRDNL